MEVKWQYAIFSKISKTHDSTDNFLRRNMNDKQCSNFVGGFPHSSSFKLRVGKFKTRLKLHKKNQGQNYFFSRGSGLLAISLAQNEKNLDRTKTHERFSQASRKVMLICSIAAPGLEVSFTSAVAFQWSPFLVFCFCYWFILSVFPPPSGPVVQC